MGQKCTDLVHILKIALKYCIFGNIVHLWKSAQFESVCPPFEQIDEVVVIADSANNDDNSDNGIKDDNDHNGHKQN